MNGATRQCQGNMAAPGVALRPGYEPGIVGRVGELHDRYYAKAWGAGAPFEILATRDMCAFIEGYDPACDLMLGAYAGERLVGSVAVLGRTAAPGQASAAAVGDAAVPQGAAPAVPASPDAADAALAQSPQTPSLDIFV